MYATGAMSKHFADIKAADGTLEGWETLFSKAQGGKGLDQPKVLPHDSHQQTHNHMATPRR